MARRQNDFYPTPKWATRELLGRVAISGLVIEPCVGDRAIEHVIAAETGCSIITSDINRQCTVFEYGDATSRDHWAFLSSAVGPPSWVVTNPPFNQAAQIIPLAYEHADIGIAMLLRLSFLEPVQDRGAWLNEHPPTTLIVLPRISFTGDGKTDNVTCAWMVWEKNGMGQQICVAENPRFPRNGSTQQLVFENNDPGKP